MNTAGRHITHMDLDTKAGAGFQTCARTLLKKMKRERYKKNK
jgi:hypothetical protein